MSIYTEPKRPVVPKSRRWRYRRRKKIRARQEKYLVDHMAWEILLAEDERILAMVEEMFNEQGEDQVGLPGPG